MVKRGGRAKYKNVNLPEELLKDVDNHISSRKYYSSRAEFVKIAINEKLLRETIMEDNGKPINVKGDKFNQLLIDISKIIKNYQK